MRFALIAAALVLVGCDQLPAGTRTEMQTVVPASLPAFFNCLRERGQTIVSAHRGGARGQLPEHSLQTYEFTLWDAPAFLEIDVRAASDGLVIMHDETIGRTTSGEGQVADLTVDQVRALTLHGMWADAHPPSLREALDWAAGKTVLELDIKRGVRFEDVIGAVEAANAMNRVVFVTYSVDGAARLARLAPQAMIYTTISNVRELDTLERRGVDLARIVAWVGSDGPPASLVEALAARGVETRFGMFGEGRDYAGAARAHAQIVAVDDAAEAVRDLDAADGEDGYAALQCATAD